MSSQSESSSTPSSSSRSEAREQADRGTSAQNQVRDAIFTRVAELADQSGDRSEFYRNLAAELLDQFRSGLVAVDTATWTNPMMLVTDDQLSQQIERTAITELLQTASKAPIACNIPQVDGEDSSRGLRVELTEAPSRAAMLLIYPIGNAPSPVQQVTDLQRLNRYAESTRQVIDTIELTEIERTKIAQTDHSQSDPSQTTMIANSANASSRSLASFHRDINLSNTAYRIANESRRVLDCDRTTLLVPHGRGILGTNYRVAAVSGVAVVDRRSNAIKSIETMVNSAVVLSRPIVLPGAQPLPPQIQMPMDQYLDESGVTTAIMLPMHQPVVDHSDDADDLIDRGPFDSDGDLVGILVLEYFSGDAPVAIDQPMSTVANEARLALGNSLEHNKVFGLKLWKAIGSLASPARAPIAAAVAVLSIALLAVSMLVHIEHQVIATGHVEPSVKRQIFTPLDGVVKELMVVDGQDVQAGDALVRLENADLESQAESIAGEIQTANKRLASLEAMRLTDSDDESSSARLAMEERQLIAELSNYNAQQRILKTQQEALIIRAPIAGKVAGWQLERRLMDRPVSRGNALMRIVDPNSPWRLQLHLPADDAGPVLDAAKAAAEKGSQSSESQSSESRSSESRSSESRSSESPSSESQLNVQFAVATLPNQTFAAKLDSISTAARLNPAGKHVIDATAPVISPDGDSGFDAFQADRMRSGADVTAKIACGERSILRSWFSDVFDFVHRNILFYF